MKSFNIIWILVIFLLFSLVSCGVYKKYVFHNAFFDCSFEYPTTHHVVDVEKADDSSRANVFIALKQLKAPQDEYITIDIIEPNSYFSSYTTLLEYDLVMSQKNQKEDEYELIKRSTIVIGDIEGEQLVYSYFRHFEPKIENDQLIKPDSVPAISYNAYFEKGGFLWEIEVRAIIERAEEGKANFEHLIRSFTFLD